MPPIQTFLSVLTLILMVSAAVFARSLFSARAWWFVVCGLLALVAGLFSRYLPLSLLGLTLLAWFGWEWLQFGLRVRTTLHRVRVAYAFADKRGPVRMLWAGQAFRVQVTVSLDDTGFSWLRYLGLQPALPYIAVSERVPYAVEQTDGEPGSTPRIDGPLRVGQPMTMSYTIRCGAIGVARFEGVRVQVSDLQGFFYHAAFVRAGVTLRVLPSLADFDSRLNTHKRHNQLLPPGAHRLRQAGSGSELLDLRDYMPGDPPRTIAWKVSARRDRLITKEFESEVPVRCTLFVDTSRSVRLATRQGTPLQRLCEIAAAVLRTNTDRRDLTGLCLFDERHAQSIRPERGSSHVTRLLHLLTDAAGLAPVSRPADIDGLLPLAYAVAEDIYPELLQPDRNAMPFWVHWMAGFPGHWRRRVGLIPFLHRRKLYFLWLATLGIPFTLTLLNLGLAFVLSPLDWALFTLITTLFSVGFMAMALVLVFATILVSWRQRRLASWRKRLAAMLSVRHGLAPGGLEAMLEDEDLLALNMQRFLADHRVPYNLPLYDRDGRYLFAAPEKLPVLGRALIEAVGRGRDNELFVLLADVLELDEYLEPLLQAVRVALGRHHQVILVCPWPAGVDLPGTGGHEDRGSRIEDRDKEPARSGVLDPRPAISAARAGTQRLLSRATRESYQAAYERVRRRLGALGVSVICAASDEAVPLILERIDRLRGVRRRV